MRNELASARSSRHLPLFGQLHEAPTGTHLHVNDARGARAWIALSHSEPFDRAISSAMGQLQQHFSKSIVMFPHDALTAYLRIVPQVPNFAVALSGYSEGSETKSVTAIAVGQDSVSLTEAATSNARLNHLESNSVFHLREALAQSKNPAMLCSFGKDSCVLFHLIKKAVFPEKVTLPLLYIDSNWDFREIGDFKDEFASRESVKILTAQNSEAIQKSINPFDHGATLHTEISKTKALRKAITEHGFDALIAGVRRSEDDTRASESISSPRTDENFRVKPAPKLAEPWSLFNQNSPERGSIRFAPIANWSETDVWLYILREKIPIPSLYFARTRPVVKRNGNLIAFDDERLQLQPGEVVHKKSVRFRSLGCYPLSTAIASSAQTVKQVITENLKLQTPERLGRSDTDGRESLIAQRMKGYF